MQGESREQLEWKLGKALGLLYDICEEWGQDTVFGPIGPDRPDVYVWAWIVEKVKTVVSKHPQIAANQHDRIYNIIDLLEQLIPSDNHREQHEKEVADLRQQLDEVCAEHDRPW